MTDATSPQSHRYAYDRLWALGLLLAGLCRLEALSISPGLFTVENIPPGNDVDLRTSGMTFSIPNGSEAEATYNLTCMKPREGGIGRWEDGYEEIPDATWCTMEHNVVTVPAKGTGEVGLKIAIPDKPEHYNRRFVLAVVLKTGANPNIGVGMALAARVLIETSVDPVRGGGALACLPAKITLTGMPGSQVSGTVQVTNGGNAALQVQSARLSEVVADPVKHPRFIGSGTQALGDASWLTAAPAPLVVPAAGKSPLAFTSRIPADAKPGQRYEELVFLRSRDPEMVRFVRVQYLVQGAEPPPAAKP